MFDGNVYAAASSLASNDFGQLHIIGRKLRRGIGAILDGSLGRGCWYLCASSDMYRALCSYVGLLVVAAGS
jgi:hypothetical protein